MTKYILHRNITTILVIDFSVFFMIFVASSQVIVESDSILDDSTRKQKVVETVDLISRKNKLPEQDDEVRNYFL